MLLRALFVVGALLTAACQLSAGGAAGGGAGRSVVAARPGTIVLTKDYKIWTMDEAGKNLQQIIAAPQNTYLRYPTWSPDGKAIAYSGLTPTGPSGLPESDLYLANADGSGSRVVVKHDQPGAAVQEPAWAPDGRALYFTYAGPKNKEKPLEAFRVEIQRLSFADSSVKTVVQDGSSPSLSRDGKWLAYVAPSPKTQDIVLFVSGPDGSSPKQLTKEGDFLLVFAPKINPAGTQIVFAAAGAPPNTPRPTPTPTSRNPILDLLGVGVAEADGVPMDLWAINVDGSGLKRLTNLSEDSPYPAWSGDGKRIAVLGLLGMYILNADGSDLKKISDGVSHGEIDWYAP